VIAYSNSQFSYLPSARAMGHPDASADFPRDTPNYNYTAALSFLWYGLPGPLTPAADEAFIQGLVELRDSDPVAVASLHHARLSVGADAWVASRERASSWCISIARSGYSGLRGALSRLRSS
jgi:hypothetical protein